MVLSCSGVENQMAANRNLKILPPPRVIVGVGTPDVKIVVQNTAFYQKNGFQPTITETNFSILYVL
jgi:hypothetical protein